MKRYDAQLAIKMEASLGEGPLWHGQEQELYFTDIVGKKVHRYRPGSLDQTVWELPSYVGAIAQGGPNKLFVAVHNKVMLLDTSTGSTKTILSLDLAKDIRFNECKCDHLGRFWMGTMHLQAQKGAGAFYRIDPDGSATQVLSGLSVPNGFCWSLDNQYLYHIDSFDYEVKRFSYEGITGSVSDPLGVIAFEEEGIVPDGMCIDEKGLLWIALWGGGKVVCYDPASGQQVAEVLVPAPHTTSCNFGGENLSTLYITTARLGLTDAQLEEFPLSGSVFCCDVESKGTELHTCKLEVK